MALDMTIVLDGGQIEHTEFLSSEIAELCTQYTYVPMKQRSRSLTSLDKIAKANKTSNVRAVSKQLPTAPKNKQFIFIDEVGSFGGTGKALVETCDNFKKKQKPGVDEFSKMFILKAR
jgi:hypothetical protein